MIWTILAFAFSFIFGIVAIKYPSKNKLFWSLAVIVFALGIISIIYDEKSEKAESQTFWNEFFIRMFNHTDW